MLAENMIDIIEVAERYGVSASTLYRCVLKRQFPAPWRPFGKRLWLPADLDLFDEWVRERSAAMADGNDPDSVPRPTYSIPLGPTKPTLCDGK